MTLFHIRKIFKCKLIAVSKEHPTIQDDVNQLLLYPALFAVLFSCPKPFTGFWHQRKPEFGVCSQFPYKWSKTAKLLWGQHWSDVTVPQSEHHTARALKACTHCQGQSCYHTDYNALNDMLAQLCSVPVQRMKSTIKCTSTQKLGFYMQGRILFC